MKRFTETEKWRDSWFRTLPADLKLAYLYVLDNCDCAGVWDPDTALAEFILGSKPDWNALKAALGERMALTKSGKWHLTKFIGYQYGDLSEHCKPHERVIKTLKSHTLSIPYKKGSTTLKEEEEEEDKEENKKRKKTEAQLKAEALFNKRQTTPWDSKERKAWSDNRATIEATTADEWALLQRFHAAPSTEKNPVYRRRDLATCLNNWSAEISRARDWAGKQGEFAEAF